MRFRFLALAAVVAGSLSPAGDALRAEVDDIKASQYDKGRRIACNIRTLNALTAMDEAKIADAERRCAALEQPASPQG